jgi:CRP-like cAMP-binding protein
VTKRPEPKTAEREPSIRVTPYLELPPHGAPLLTERQRQALIQLATRLRLPGRMIVYEEDSPAKWLFIVAEGAVKTFRDLPSGRRRIANFLFRGDIFGLAEKGKYVNTAQALTRTTLYRIGMTELTAAFHHDVSLQYIFLCKVTHELREQQRRAIAITRRDAPGRLAMFLVMLRSHLFGTESREAQIPLAMSRSDIADFLALSREATSRASTELERRGLVEFQRGRTVKIVDDDKLIRLAAAV